MKILFLISFLFFVNLSWSQKYAVAFNGEIDTTILHQMERECEQFQSVSKVKINYKPEKQKGELIIQLSEDEKSKRGEGDDHFSIAEIKAYLISKNLTPVSFITLEK